MALALHDEQHLHIVVYLDTCKLKKLVAAAVSRAAKPCNQHGCPNLQPCPQHTPPAWAGSTRRSRLPPDWNRIRRRILRRDPTCKVCTLRPSTQVDHVEPGDDHRDENLRGICTECHASKTGREGNAARGTR